MAVLKFKVALHAVFKSDKNLKIVITRKAEHAELKHQYTSIKHLYAS